MLCSLLKIWNAYTIANSYGKMFSNQADEPVAMMMSYNHRDVAIVNQREYVRCFTTEIAMKANVPVLTIAPDMYKFTTENIDHYVFFDENASIKLPPKVQENKTIREITRHIEKFSSTHEKGEKVDELVAKVSGKDIPRSVQQKIKDMVHQIVQKEHAKDESTVKIRAKLGKTLKKEIKDLVHTILHAHRNREITKRRIHNILEIVKHTKHTKNSKNKKIFKSVKALIRSIVKMNAQSSITPKKIDRILTISRSYPPKVALRKIRHIIHSVIRTRTNSALTKNTIAKMFKYVRSHSSKLSERKIEKKIKRMFMNIVNTTVSTIIPKDKVFAIIYTSRKDRPENVISKKIKNIIHDIRVEEDDEEDEDDCPVCKCKFKKSKKSKKSRKSKKSKKHLPKLWTKNKDLSLSEVVKLVPTVPQVVKLVPKLVRVVPTVPQVVRVVQPVASMKKVVKHHSKGKKGKKHSKGKKGKTGKTGKKGKKGKKISLSKKIKMVSKEIVNLKNKKILLTNKLKTVVT